MSTELSVGTYSDNTATRNGTKIVQTGQDMDKNAFLKILAAELTNQDPTESKDSTQYITQMAQFTAMEQTANLNNTMSGLAANSLIGKGVITNVKDANGVVYAGVVRDVTNDSGNITLGIEVTSGTTTEILEFDYDEVATVSETTNYSLENLSTNTAFLTAATMIGKKGEFTLDDDTTVTGIIKGIVKESGILKLSVLPDGSSETQVLSLSNLVKLDAVE